eukprot:3476077-Lingulodinium_polyedra.AAC.1
MVGVRSDSDAFGSPGSKNSLNLGGAGDMQTGLGAGAWADQMMTRVRWHGKPHCGFLIFQ